MEGLQGAGEGRGSSGPRVQHGTQRLSGPIYSQWCNAQRNLGMKLECGEAPEGMGRLVDRELLPRKRMSVGSTSVWAGALVQHSSYGPLQDGHLGSHALPPTRERWGCLRPDGAEHSTVCTEHPHRHPKPMLSPCSKPGSLLSAGTRAEPTLPIPAHFCLFHVPA